MRPSSRGARDVEVKVLFAMDSTSEKTSGENSPVCEVTKGMNLGRTARVLRVCWARARWSNGAYFLILSAQRETTGGDGSEWVLGGV